MAQLKLLIFVAAISLGVMAITGAARADELVGRGKWQSLSGGDHIKGKWSVDLKRTGTRVEGTMELSGSNVLTGGSVEGSIDGDSVLLGVSSNGVVAASFSGQLDGNSISGYWECAAVKDEGVWEGDLIARPADASASVGR